MILGIGSDLAKLDRISDVLDRHGQRFIDRCFTEIEQKKANRFKKDSEEWTACYAKRWAAKEACAKALGVGIAQDVYLKDIGVENATTGSPSITLTGGAKKRLTEMTPSGMVIQIDLSLSDDPPYALAFVVISAIAPND